MSTNLLAFLLALVQEVVVYLHGDSLGAQGIIILHQLVRLIITLGQLHRARRVLVNLRDVLGVEKISEGLSETGTWVT